MIDAEITGTTRNHIVDLQSPRCSLHYAAVTSLLAMRDAAARVGIDLQCSSAFRDFNAQLSIWNRKWRGELPLFDRSGQRLARESLSDDTLLDTILTWSAIPGGSRHHWGSDVDLIDAAARPEGYQVQLIPSEYAPDGVFARLSAWLNEHAAGFGFFRPYQTDRGGVSPEPWHFSYAPVSMLALENLSLATLRRTLEASEIEGKAQVLARLPEIYTRFLLNIDLPPTSLRVSLGG